MYRILNGVEIAITEIPTPGRNCIAETDEVGKLNVISLTGCGRTEQETGNWYLVYSDILEDCITAAIGSHDHQRNRIIRNGIRIGVGRIVLLTCISVAEIPID